MRINCMTPRLPILLVLPALAFGQHTLTCEDNSSYGGSDRMYCEVRDMKAAPAGSLRISPGHNGSVRVTGWDRNEVSIRARVQAWADTDAEARARAAKVQIVTSGGEIRATASDEILEKTGVSFEVFTPRKTNIDAGAHNGSVSASKLEGRIQVSTHNGSIRFSELKGKVEGRTHNGSVRVNLDGTTWQGEGLTATTHNGSVKLGVPKGYSARLHAGSDRGGLHSDIPLTLKGKLTGPVDVTLGGGGPLISATTHNGRVSIEEGPVRD